MKHYAITITFLPGISQKGKTFVRKQVAAFGGLHRNYDTKHAEIERDCRAMSNIVGVKAILLTLVDEQNAGIYENGRKRRAGQSLQRS